MALVARAALVWVLVEVAVVLDGDFSPRFPSMVPRLQPK